MKVGFFFSLFYFLEKEEIGFLGSEEFRIKNLPRMKLFAESRQTSEKLDAASPPPALGKSCRSEECDAPSEEHGLF